MSAAARQASGTAVEIVIFDLGGVVLELGGVGAMRRLAGIDSDEELWRRWLACRWVRAFERGHCSAAEFAAGVVDDWSLTISPVRFLDEFRGWIGGPMPGAEDLVTDVARRLPVACLSNTNAEHWAAGSSNWELLGLFDHRFLSFEMGLVKPDPEVFSHVCAALGVEPSRAAFLDDNALNVEAAVQAGLRAKVARGVAEARSALVELAVIDVG